MSCVWKLASCEKPATTYPPAPRAELKWIGVDFDGTIAESTWSATDPFALPGEPIVSTVQKMSSLRSRGWKLVIHSSRPWSDFELVESYLDHYSIPYDRIVLGKLLCAAYYDDRNGSLDDTVWGPPPALPSEADWGPVGG